VKGRSGARFKKAMSAMDEAAILKAWGVQIWTGLAARGPKLFRFSRRAGSTFATGSRLHPAERLLSAGARTAY